MNLFTDHFSNIFTNLSTITGQQGWELAAWTMCYFLAAGTGVALVGALLRLLCKRATPQVRYAISLATFAILTALPVGIAAWLANTATPLPLAHSSPTAASPLLAVSPIEPTHLPPTLTSPAHSPAPLTIDLKYQTLPAATEGQLTEAVPSARAPSTTPGVINPTPSVDAMSTEAMPGAALFGLAIKYLPWLWVIGAPLTFVLLTTGLIGSERLRRQCSVLAEGPLHEATARVARSLAVSRRVGVAISQRIASPLLIGIVRPMILLPPVALTGWTPDELEMVLLHELAHVRRWDNLVNFGQRLVESLLFFHPCVWWVSRWVRTDREQCCDAVVVQRTEQPQAYAELLVALATPTSPIAGLAMAQHPLAGRIRRILRLEDEKMLVSRSTITLAGTALTGLLIALLWAPVALTGAEEKQADGIEKEVVTAEVAESAKAALDNRPDVVINAETSDNTIQDILARFKKQGSEFNIQKNGDGTITVDCTKPKEHSFKGLTAKAAIVSYYKENGNQHFKDFIGIEKSNTESAEEESENQDILTKTFPDASGSDGGQEFAASLKAQGKHVHITKHKDGTVTISGRDNPGPTPVQPPPSVFPTLEEQRSADLAYKLLRVELEQLGEEELARAKAKKFDGGLLVSSGRNKGAMSLPLEYGDLLVGLHVWPTTSLADVQKILQRDDIAELSPLKFYVIRKTQRPVDSAQTGGGGGAYGGGFDGGYGRAVPTETVDKLVTGRIEVNVGAIKKATGDLSRYNAPQPAYNPGVPIYAPQPIAPGRVVVPGQPLVSPVTNPGSFRPSSPPEFQQPQYQQSTTPGARPRLLPHKLAAGDFVKVVVDGTPPDKPINDVYPVESMGTIALGPTYGRVKVAGLTVAGAEEKVEFKLREVLKDVSVQITLVKQPSTFPQPSRDRYPGSPQPMYLPAAGWPPQTTVPNPSRLPILASAPFGNRGNPTLMFFHDPTSSAPSKAMKSIVRQITKQMSGQIDVGYVDVNQSPESASNYQVTKVPTLLLFQYGKKIGTYQGEPNVKDLKSFINSKVIRPPVPTGPPRYNVPPPATRSQVGPVPQGVAPHAPPSATRSAEIKETIQRIKTARMELKYARAQHEVALKSYDAELERNRQNKVQDDDVATRKSRVASEAARLKVQRAQAVLADLEQEKASLEKPATSEDELTSQINQRLESVQERFDGAIKQRRNSLGAWRVAKKAGKDDSQLRTNYFMHDAKLQKLRRELDELKASKSRLEAEKILLAQNRVAAPSSPTLLYDNKTFDEWRALWKNELKTERRTEAIRAMAAFGRAGYGQEAAEALLDVAGEYDFNHWGGGSVEGKLKKKVLELLNSQTTQCLAPQLWLPGLLKRYQADPKKWKLLAYNAIWRMSFRHSLDEFTRKQLIEIVRGDDAHLRGAAIGAFSNVEVEDAELRQLTEELAASSDLEKVRSGLLLTMYWSNRGFGGGGGMGGSKSTTQLRSVPAMLQSLEHPNLEIRRLAREFLARVDKKYTQQVTDAILKKIETAKTDEQRIVAIRTLAVLSDQNADIAKATEKHTDKQYSDNVRIAAACAYILFPTNDGDARKDLFLRFQGEGIPITEKKYLEEQKILFPPETETNGGGMSGGGGGGFF